MNGSEICSTMEHPFRHKEKGWVRAEELLPGDFFKAKGRGICRDYLYPSGKGEKRTMGI